MDHSMCWWPDDINWTNFHAATPVVASNSPAVESAHAFKIRAGAGEICRKYSPNPLPTVISPPIAPTFVNSGILSILYQVYNQTQSNCHCKYFNQCCLHNHKKSMKAVLATLLILCLLSHQIRAGPLSCAACFGYGGAGTAGIFTAAGSCFAMALPWLICPCLAGLGVAASITTVIVCVPICLASPV